MSNKKRTSLSDVLGSSAFEQSLQPIEPSPAVGKRPHVKQQTLYLPIDVHRRLKLLALEEDKRQHALLLEAIDLLFVDRGLPGIDER